MKKLKTKMKADDDIEQYNEKYDEVTVLNSESSFYDSPNKEIHLEKSKVSNRKRPILDRKHSSIHVSKKTCKETTRDRLFKWNRFYSNEKFGIFVQCTKCKKWRKVLEYEEEHQVPTDWCCSMNLSGPKDCNEPENFDDEDFSPTEFVPGSIVWAKLYGYPWWPGLVEDDPDTEEYYWEDDELFYNVTFLDDKVSRAWVPAPFVRSFLTNPPKEKLKNYRIKYSQLIEDAKKRANTAITMPIKDRLKNFSFANRYRGKWALAGNFDNNEEDNDEEDPMELTEMLIKEVEKIDSIKSTDSENEMNSSIEEADDYADYKSNKMKKCNTTSDKKNINLKYRQVKKNISQPNNSNQEQEKVIVNENNEHLAQQKIEEKGTVNTLDSCKKKNYLIDVNTTETMPCNRKKDENKVINSASTKTEKKNTSMKLQQCKSNNALQNLSFKNESSQVRWNKTNEKLELKNKKDKKNHILSNIKTKKFVSNEMVDKSESQNLKSEPNKKVSCKLPNSKKKLPFQPPIRDSTKIASKPEKKGNDIISLQKDNNDSSEITILDSIPNNHTEKTVSELDAEHVSNEENSKPEKPKTYIDNGLKIKEEEKEEEKNEIEINIHNSTGKQKSQNLTGNSIQENVISGDKVSHNNFKDSKTKEKFKTKKQKSNKETEINKTKNIKEKKSDSIDQILKILDQDINDSDGNICGFNSATEKNCPDDCFNKLNPQNENLEPNSSVDNIEQKVHTKTAGCGKNDLKDSKLRQENISNFAQKKSFEKKNPMKSSKQNAPELNTNSTLPKQASNKKDKENKKANNKQFSNNNTSKQGNVIANTKPDIQCRAERDKNIETSKKKGSFLCKQNNSNKNIKIKNLPQEMYNKIHKYKSSNKNYTNATEVEETSIILNSFDDGDQDNYSFS